MLWMLLLAATLAPDQWPQFRGPDGSGVAEDPRLPERWSQTENVAWKTDIPGLGWSSPVVWGDRIFVTSVIPLVEQEKPRTGMEGPDRSDGRSIYRVTVGLQRPDLRAQRGRRHLRDPGGSGVPVARQELARRDDAGHARDCPRKSLHPDRFTTVSYPPAQGD